LKHFFIVNPAAGKINADNCRKGIEAVCAKRRLDFEIAYSTKRGDVEKIAREAVEHGFNRIYAIGGDGTLNEAANAVIAHIKVCDGNADVALVPVAAGTGNDFVRSLGCPDEYKKFALAARKSDAVTNKSGGQKSDNGAEWEKYISAVVDGSVKNIDCASANGRYFINIASMGIDADVAKNMSKFKHSKLCPDSLAYLASVAYTFIKYKPFDFEISIDGGEPVKGEYSLIAVANGCYYGGGIKPAPKADLCNGKLDVCIASKIKKLQIINFFPKYAKGTHENLPVINILQCKKITISSPETIYLNLDGEIVDADNVTFEMLDFKLPVVEISKK